MNSLELPCLPVEGKTYSLFGDFNSTEEYYRTVRALADKILAGNDLTRILEILREYSPKRRYLKTIVSQGGTDSMIEYCLNTIQEPLKRFTGATREHLKNLSLYSRLRDRRLATTEEQYHLFMLEIELTNRLNRDLFLKADRKISLHPHCLQDFAVTCKATDAGFDVQCRMCSKNCYQNRASQLLKEKDIDPYIWMSASIAKEARKVFRANQTFGILGIACIPELVWGMRKCRKYGIPAVGIPLNANRCARWFGEFRQNSVDLNELTKLITQE